MNPITNNYFNAFVKFTAVTSTTCLTITSIATEVFSCGYSETEDPCKTLNQVCFISGCIASVACLTLFLPHYRAGIAEAERTERKVLKIINKSR